MDDELYKGILDLRYVNIVKSTFRPLTDYEIVIHGTHEVTLSFDELVALRDLLNELIEAESQT